MTEVLKAAGSAPDKIGVWKVNEALAFQAPGVLREQSVQFEGFEVPDDRLNPNGGAVAVGHPFEASGTRDLGVCADSRQGVAGLLENDQA